MSVMEQVMKQDIPQAQKDYELKIARMFEDFEKTFHDTRTVTNGVYELSKSYGLSDIQAAIYLDFKLEISAMKRALSLIMIEGSLSERKKHRTGEEHKSQENFSATLDSICEHISKLEKKLDAR